MDSNHGATSRRRVGFHFHRFFSPGSKVFFLSFGPASKGKGTFGDVDGLFICAGRQLFSLKDKEWICHSKISVPPFTLNPTVWHGTAGEHILLARYTTPQRTTDCPLSALH